MNDVVISGLAPMCPGMPDPSSLRGSTGLTSLFADREAREWFDPARLLGPRGWRYFTDGTRFLTAAVRSTLRDARPLEHGTLPETAGQPADDTADWLPPPQSRGVVVGSNFGALALNHRLDEGLAGGGIEGITPMQAPTFSINVPASHVSIAYGFRGFNITLTNPVTASLEALAVGASAIRRGRARFVVAAAVEEAVPAELGLNLPMPEGACVLALETHADAVARGRAPYATLSRTTEAFLRNRAEAGRIVGGWLAARPVDDAPVYVCGPGASVAVEDGIRDACTAAGVRPSAFGASHGTLPPMVAVAYVAATVGHGVVVALDHRGHACMVVLRRPGDRSEAADG